MRLPITTMCALLVCISVITPYAAAIQCEGGGGRISCDPVDGTCTGTGGRLPFQGRLLMYCAVNKSGSVHVILDNTVYASTTSSNGFVVNTTFDQGVYLLGFHFNLDKTQLLAIGSKSSKFCDLNAEMLTFRLYDGGGYNNIISTSSSLSPAQGGGSYSLLCEGQGTPKKLIDVLYNASVVVARGGDIPLGALHVIDAILARNAKSKDTLSLRMCVALDGLVDWVAVMVPTAWPLTTPSTKRYVIETLSTVLLSTDACFKKTTTRLSWFLITHSSDLLPQARIPTIFRRIVEVAKSLPPGVKRMQLLDGVKRLYGSDASSHNLDL